MSHAPTALDITARELTIALRARSEPSATTFHTVWRELLARVPRQPATSEPDTVVSAVLERFVAAVRSGKVEPATAGAYLATALRNAAIDEQRRSRVRREHPERLAAVRSAEADDAVTRLLDANAARDAVHQALKLAADDERYSLVRVITQWLDLAERDGEPPSSRDVAIVLGISHTAVNQALSTFRRSYLPEADHGA
jgi:DNA-directed RNA polymerase specialized sigma24 family protein